MPLSDADLEVRLSKLRKTHPDEVGGRVHQVIELIEEILRLRASVKQTVILDRNKIKEPSEPVKWVT